MIHLKTAAGVIDVHDDVRQLTAARYQRFSAKHLEMSVGSDVFAVDGGVSRLSLFLTSGDLAGARAQFNAVVLALFNVQEGTHGEAVALACLVAGIDGQPCDDLSDAGLLATANRLLASGLTQHRLRRTLERAKKDLSETLGKLFPALFPGESHAFDDQLRARLLLTCEALLSDAPDAYAQPLADAEAALLQMMRPANLNGQDGGNAFLAVERGFEQACIQLEAKGVVRPGELTLYAFYSRLQYYASQPATA